jgi:prophage regulatory protein
LKIETIETQWRYMMVKKTPGVQTATSPRDTEVRVIRHEQARKKLQISGAKLFDLIAKGQFPKPFKLIPGGRAVGWLEADVDAWVLARKADSEGGIK